MCRGARLGRRRLPLPGRRGRLPTGVGRPDDIAGIVLFLARDDSRFVTGGEVAGDGGQSAGQANCQGIPR
ncbi:SDR family oxidoreductase [Streptomyces sp. CRN 30]|uniref:SDR family oxidoreductase n=1 Tax=Streptomyces sp. CRN 30 TaxID=3075613 RepID=UPI002A834FD2|nr:SDR family oxidoreductase [Streptomyces sp. CRN 30]